METATFATSVWHLDNIERKPLYHFRPGSRALTLASPGCSFRCGYCQNYRLSQFGRHPEAAWSARPVDLENVVAEAEAADGIIAFSYSEPTLAAELTLDLAKHGRDRKISLVWKTNGFITEEALTTIAPCLAAVNVDLKAANEESHRQLTGASLAPVVAAIKHLKNTGVWVEISTPLIPGFNTDDASILAMAKLITSISPEIPWHLVRFMPDHLMRTLPPTSPALLAHAARLAARADIQHVYVERALHEQGRNTLCPSCHSTFVRRGIWSLESSPNLDGRCPNCGFSIPGRWHRPSPSPLPCLPTAL